MEIKKQNESFVLTDVNDVYKTSGHITYDVTGTLNVHFSVNTLNDDYVGDCHYAQHGDTNDVNFGINCAEIYRRDLTAYADSVIAYLLQNFKFVK